MNLGEINRRTIANCFPTEDWEWLLQQGEFQKLLTRIETVQERAQVVLAGVDLLLARKKYPVRIQHRA